MHDAKNCLVERYVPHGMDIFEMFADLSYAGVLAVLVAVNTAPILMPPTWIILSSFYAADPSFNPVYLALVGATGATAGRFILQRISRTIFLAVDLYKENKNQTWITSRVILGKKNSDMHCRFFLQG